MANTYLQKQTALAKKIRKANPKLKWTDCVKKAAAELRQGKKVGAYKVIEKGESKNAKPKAIYQITRTKKGTFKKDGVKKINGYAPEGNQYKVRDMMEKDLQSAVKYLQLWQNNYYPNEKPTMKRKMISYYKKRIMTLKKAVRQQNILINSLLK